MTVDALTDVLQTVKGKIKRYSTKGINEQDTKATLIQPVLRALGWDVEDLEDVQREYKRRKQDKPVDYALLVLRTPCLFVEAKALGQSLDDRRWANQIMGYATVAGVKWVVITNGDEYRIYNACEAVPVEEKLFRSVSVTNEDGQAQETLGLLSRDRVADNEIDLLWQAHFVDRQIQAALADMFSAEADSAIVRMLKKRIPSLTPKDIQASLSRLRVRFEFPIDLNSPSPSDRPTKRSNAAKKAWETRRGYSAGKSGKNTSERAIDSIGKKQEAPKSAGVSLSDLIRAGLLKTPLRLTKHYKGHDLEAKLLADGRIAFQGKIYATCSTAADHARATVTGRRMNTNGWEFWKVETPKGWVYLDMIRQEFLQENVR